MKNATYAFDTVLMKESYYYYYYYYWLLVCLAVCNKMRKNGRPFATDKAVETVC